MKMDFSTDPLMKKVFKFLSKTPLETTAEVCANFPNANETTVRNYIKQFRDKYNIYEEVAKVFMLLHRKTELSEDAHFTNGEKKMMDELLRKIRFYLGPNWMEEV